MSTCHRRRLFDCTLVRADSHFQNTDPKRNQRSHVSLPPLHRGGNWCPSSWRDFQRAKQLHNGISGAKARSMIVSHSSSLSRRLPALKPTVDLKPTMKHTANLALSYSLNHVWHQYHQKAGRGKNGWQKQTKICVLIRIRLMDWGMPGSSVHGASPDKNAGVGCHSLLQGIFPTQGLNPGLLYCRRILDRLSHQGVKYWQWCLWLAKCQPWFSIYFSVFYQNPVQQKRVRVMDQKTWTLVSVLTQTGRCLIVLPQVTLALSTVKWKDGPLTSLVPCNAGSLRSSHFSGYNIKSDETQGRTSQSREL